MKNKFGLNTISHGDCHRGMFFKYNNKYHLKQGTLSGISSKKINNGLPKIRALNMDMITDIYEGMYFANCPTNAYAGEVDIDYEYMDQFYLSKSLSAISADFRVSFYTR